MQQAEIASLHNGYRRLWRALQQSEILAVTLLFAVLLALFLGPALFGDRIMLPADMIYMDDVWRPFTPPDFRGAANPVPSDQITQYYPWRLFCGQAARQWGEIPLWNPYVFAGTPFLANAQSAPLYPINWLGYLISAARFFAWAGFLRFCLAGLFTYLFMRSLGAVTPAALLAALTYAFCGPMVVWLSHPNTDVFLWLPGVLWALERACQSRRPARWLAVTAVLVGTQGLAGHFQSLFHALAVTAAYALFRLHGLTRRCSEEQRALRAWSWITGRPGRMAAGVALALAAGVALSAPQTLPFAEFLAESGTLAAGGRTSVRAMDGWLYTPRVWPNLASALTLVVPDLFGNPATHDYFWTYWMPQNYNEQATYVGTLQLILALAALGRARRHRERLFFIGLAVFCFGVAFRLPVFEAVNHLPVFVLILNKRLRFVLSFALAILAGWGAHDLFQPCSRSGGEAWRVARLAARFTAVLVLGLGGWYLFVHALRSGAVDPGWSPAAVHGVLNVFRWERVRTYLPALVALAAVALLYLYAARRIPRQALIVCALLLAGGELLATGWRYYPLLPRQQLFPDTPALAYLRAQPQPLRILGAGNALLSNWPMATGLPEIGGYDLPVSQRMARLYTRLGGGDIHRQRWSPDWPLLELWSVQYVVGAGDLPVERYELVYDGEVRIHRLRAPMPRVFSVEEVEVVAGELEALNRLLAPGLDYRRRALVEAAPGALAGPFTAAEDLRLVRYEANRVEVRGRFPGPGFLVVADAFDDDWQVRIDGEPARLYPADYLLRGVAVPAGEHTIEFRYAPGAFWQGVATALVALAILGGILVVEWVRADS